MLTEVGIATTATDPGLRWIAMRHADDHVHIVATLVREDGRTNWMRNDYPRCVKATYNVAGRYNLHRRVPLADRTTHANPPRRGQQGPPYRPRSDPVSYAAGYAGQWQQPARRRRSSPAYVRQEYWSGSGAAAPTPR
ncbi:hypothetical protein [Micromonospora inaquosa]|uniref:Uncharacterized protein n=1 Tax=Micromonospora inaquosa TaxID=2203716 RepID=A0A3N9WXB5_9ACTN|nr:hypothetical protein [Micromonospora inaquosa]RQX05310.1 hypothetical protein DLJ59_07930 [Micromonospora inaquosa]